MLKILAVIIILGFVYFWLFNNKRMKTYKHYMKRKSLFDDCIKDFQASEKYVNQNVALAVNHENKKIVTCIMKEGSPVSFERDFKDIKGCAILEDGVPVKTNLPDEQQGSIPVVTLQKGKTPGSAIGSMFEKGERISRLDLQIVFNDLKSTSVLANFLFWEVSKESEDYRKLIEDAMHWYEIIDNITVR